MEWYWYIAGINTTLFAVSFLLNVGFATGFVKIKSNKRARVVHLYDQDADHEHQWSA